MPDDPPRSRIHTAVWELTLQCNLGCAHCGSRAGAARSDELSTEEALGLVRQLADLRVEEVTLIGGEAYLRADWELIARAIADRGMACSMVTAGRGVDAAIARRAREAGIGTVSVSVDGLPETHDRLRGVAGSWGSAIQAMRHLAEEGISVGANTHVNRVTLEELEGLEDVLLAEPVEAWKLQLTVPMGRAADHPEMLLQPYEYLDLFPRLARMKVRAIEGGLILVIGNSLGYFGPYETLLRGDVKGGGHWTGCAAGEGQLGIEADGTIKGCPSLPTRAYAGGNVRTRPLREIVDDTPEVRFARDRTVDALWGFCRSCYYADVCRGGCTWTAHSLLGRAGNNPYCHHRALELEKQGLHERIVPVEKPPGLPFDHGRFEIRVEPIPSQVEANR